MMPDDHPFSICERESRATMDVLALAIASVLVVVYAVFASGCAHPWNVQAHAVVNAHAYGLAAVDGVTAALITGDPRSQAEREERWGPVVLAERATLEALREAERVIDAAEAIKGAPDKCRALLAVRLVVVEFARTVRVLGELGVEMPEEVKRAAELARTLAPLITSNQCGSAKADTVEALEILARSVR